MSNSQQVGRARLHAHATRAALELGRVCALPTCPANGGQHGPLRCSDPHCPETARLGGEHSALLEGCNGAAARAGQCKLWKIGGCVNNPSEWWCFCEPGDVLKGITLPPELDGYTLNGLKLNVRMHNTKQTRVREQNAPAIKGTARLLACSMVHSHARDELSSVGRKIPM